MFVLVAGWMLTEGWPLDHDPQWPARWSLEAGPRPKVVHLDQWCFDHLARDRAGTPMHPTEAGTYTILRDMALDGAVIFPLSQVHYRENWKRENLDARWDTAVVMGELSGFHTLHSTSLDYWDASVGAAAFLGLPVTFERPEPLGWGLNHCLTGKPGQAFILDTGTGAPAQWDQSLPPDTLASLEELAAAAPYQFELAILALRDPRMEPVFAPLVAIPDDKGAMFADSEKKIRAAIDKHGRTAQVVRNTVELLAFNDSLRLFDPLLQGHGLDPLTIVNAVAADVTGGRSPSMHRLLQAMPIQGAFTELRVQTHLQASWRTQESDVLDYLALASALPFVELFVADRKTFNLATRALLDGRGGGKVLRTLRSLCDELQTLV